MKIAIIGGGWVGCHLANKLKKEHEIVLFEKNKSLFSETSYNNQNRLHLGYHYARNGKTRNMCKNTFNSFINDYDFLTKEISKNYYCVVKNKSILDFETYRLIFGLAEETEILSNFNNLENCINTDEKYIDFKKAKEYFNNVLKDVFVNEKISKDRLSELSNEFDLVINATNNQITEIENGAYFELALSLVYERIKPTNFDAVTMVDGQFFSIYPYDENLYTLTDVEHTPLNRFENINELFAYKENIDIDFITSKVKKMEEKVSEYFPEFSKHFLFIDYFLSVKTKPISLSDDRHPIIKIDKNIVSCFTGKIQGIYIIENNVLNIINQITNENSNR